MKKRLLIILLLISLCLTACSSSGTPGKSQGSIRVYRPTSGDLKAGHELLSYDTFSLEEGADPVKGAVYALSSIPDKDSLCCALPSNVKITEAHLSGRTVKVYLNKTFSDLDGFQKSLTLSCITLTLCSISEVDSVSVYVDREPYLRNLTEGSLVLSNTVVSPQEAMLRLYFPKKTGGIMGIEYRSVTLSEDDFPERFVMEALMDGPQNPDFAPALPQNIVLLSAYTQDGICTVNFSADFLGDEDVTEVTAKAAVYSIVNSLTALSNIDSVQILVDGHRVQNVSGIDILSPLSKNEGVNIPVVDD